MGIVFEDDDGNEELFEPYESKKDYYHSNASSDNVGLDTAPKYAYFMEDLRLVQLFISNVLQKDYPQEVKTKELLRVYTYFKELLYEIRQQLASVYKRNWRPPRRDFQHFLKHVNGILEIITEAVKCYDRNDQRGIHYFIYHLLIFVI